MEEKWQLFSLPIAILLNVAGIYYCTLLLNKSQVSGHPPRGESMVGANPE